MKLRPAAQPSGAPGAEEAPGDPRLGHDGRGLGERSAASAAHVAPGALEGSRGSRLLPSAEVNGLQ